MFKEVSGFSKLEKNEKINLLVKDYLNAPDNVIDELKSFWHKNENAQKVFDEFSENTLTNFYFPFGVIPNFKLNDKNLFVPMVIEESSVVAACAKAAKFWMARGGFKSEVVSAQKVGQVHFNWTGKRENLFKFFESVRPELIEHVSPLLSNMEKRGGGLTKIELVDKTELEEDYYQLFCSFETCDAMGANFINSVLEGLGQKLKDMAVESELLEDSEKEILIIMAILSNYTPDCLVRSWVECPIEELRQEELGMDPNLFVKKFQKAIKIAQIDVYRATTHNKGIFNGVDAVVLATGNDFRAVEACGHTYAARSGQYRSLTNVEIKDGKFKFYIELPLSLGTVGGLTSLHPLAKFSLDLLGRPSAQELMMVVASVGLAQNFAALRSLVTTGIQKGHMKMHLMNILNQLEANAEEREKAKVYFENKTVSFNSVRELLAELRDYH